MSFLEQFKHRESEEQFEARKKHMEETLGKTVECVKCKSTRVVYWLFPHMKRCKEFCFKCNNFKWFKVI